MEKDIWIYAEHRDGKVADSFYELLTKAREVAEAISPEAKVAAVALGNHLDAVVEELKGSGAELVYAVRHERLETYSPERRPAALAELAGKYHPLMLWVAASSEGAEIAPSVAAKLKTGLAAHCVDISCNPQGEVVHLVPAFGGKLLNEILIPRHRPMMATVKPGIFRRGETAPVEDAEVIWEPAAILDTWEERIQLVAQEEIPPVGRAVEKADVVVAGGLGIRNPETWEKAKKLAAALDGAVGYTRPLIDLGLEKTDENMIGASGKSVRPKLYLAFGISGASHHVCGMKDSGLVLSVNRDENAEIFHVSDYKVVADCGEILDALLKELDIS